jgi:hypothetical protein
MAALVSFPSRYTRIKHILLLTVLKWLRTFNDHRDLVVDASHLIVDIEYLNLDSMRGLQNSCSYHPELFICQLVQPLQRIFYVSLSNQPLQILF